jgi:serralysin
MKARDCWTSFCVCIGIPLLLGIVGCCQANHQDNNDSTPTDPTPNSPSKESNLSFIPCSSLDEPEEERANPLFGSNNFAGPNDTFWEAGSTLHVAFLDGTTQGKQEVARIASEWMKYANIKLKFHLEKSGTAPHILITFKGQGYHSLIGSPSRRYASMGKPSMTLSKVDQMVVRDPTQARRIVLHEFGHALGLIHEHQNPHANIQWNKPVVHRHYARQGWSKKTVDHNLFEKDKNRKYTASDFDPKSIMLYAIPKEFTLNGFSSQWNTVLSAKDKQYIGMVYGKGKSKETPDDNLEQLKMTNKAQFVREKNGKKWYKWTISITGPTNVTQRVRSVRYLLHPTFSPFIVEGNANKPGFPLTRTGWGAFTVRSIITLDNGEIISRSHRLRFPKN